MDKKILIVEDDQMICSMYKTKFEAEGLTCLIANDGLSGLELAKKENPNLIMLDVILPQLDGFSILKELKADSKTKSIPVIMLTNLGTDEDKKKGEELGAADYWVKASLTPTEISKKIKEHLK
ncbi:MAG: response regulator [Patescibacteria group bacterium]|nr:response regulator [Patescibacteria group bacterium]